MGATFRIWTAIAAYIVAAALLPAWLFPDRGVAYAVALGAFAYAPGALYLVWLVAKRSRP